MAGLTVVVRRWGLSVEVGGRYNEKQHDLVIKTMEVWYKRLTRRICQGSSGAESTQRR